MNSHRLRRQLDFVLEIDRLKTILRRTTLLDRSRNENSAEHSWHLAVMVLVLSEYARGEDFEEVDTVLVLKMLLVHDLVEIDAGDTFCYDAAANDGKAERERLAADRLFGLLPEDQGGELRALWEEFEARATPEARFANALDRLQPILHNLHTGGGSWAEHGIKSHQVYKRNQPIADGAPDLWDYIDQRLKQAMEEGWLPE